MQKYIQLIRLNNYSKNFLLFVPWVFEHKLNVLILTQLIFIFLIFSFVTSVNYIINDIKDLKEDKNHFVKKNRPLANNEINIFQAYGSILFLLALIILLFLFYDYDKLKLINYLSIYLSISLLYTLFLKKIIFLDILILSFFYIFRIVAGALIVDIEISFWLILFSFFIFIYLASNKKRLDYFQCIDKSKSKYSIQHLRLLKILSISSLVFSCIVMILYSFSDANQLNNNPHFYSFFVLIILFIHIRLDRMISLNNKEEFINIFLKDKVLYIAYFVSILIVIVSY